jgi:hypothetical protein
VSTLCWPLGQALEVHDFHVVQPNFDQVVALFTAVFRFVSVLMAVVTLFSVANTINMAVGERTGEIGTLRALGMKRGPVRSMFLIEGAMLGAVGAGLGALLGIVLSEYVINASGMSWTPPGRATPVPVGVDVLGDPAFMAIAVAFFRRAGLCRLLPCTARRPAGNCGGTAPCLSSHEAGCRVGRLVCVARTAWPAFACPHEMLAASDAIRNLRAASRCACNCRNTGSRG